MAKGNLSKVNNIGVHKDLSILDHPDGSVTTEKIADGAVTEKKLDMEVIKNTAKDEVDKRIVHASDKQYGVVKIPTKSGIVSYDGELIVNTNSQYGTSRTGDGKVVIASATNVDIDAGTNNYKPIVPVNLKYAVQSVTGKFENLLTAAKNNIIAAINEICNYVFSNDIYDNFQWTAPGTPDAGTIYYAGLSEVCSDVYYLKKNKYSEKPVQVGTWLDGTPVWRMAFYNAFTEQDIADMEEFGTAGSGYYYFPVSLPCNNFDSVFVIDAKGFLINQFPCVIDDAPCEYNGQQEFIVSEADFQAIKNGILDKYMGWIEFVTPESNLIEI